jgi:hypothetical protein
MKKKVLFLFAMALLWCAAASAQQMQPITFVSEYWVKPGKEEDFMWLVNNLGAPVRDKLMADGVVLAWGVDVPVMRAPGQATHTIWYDAHDWAGVEKVQNAMAARLAEFAAQDKKAAEEARKKGQKPPKTVAERIEETFDISKTRDWVFRNLYVKFGSGAPPAGLLPYGRFFMVATKPGKATEWRAAFDKYLTPTLNSLVDKGVIGAWGLGVEEVKTVGDFTHFVWVSYPNMAAMETVRNTFVALGASRSEVENHHINHVFTETADANAARSFISRAIIFKVAGQPK